jgi:SAM-dependent methyltransferase
VWPNATTNQMSNAAIPQSGGAVLDLGCGTGALSVSAAPKSKSVTATDLNPRAAGFTVFNARLNGAGEIETLTGDCYDPVAGRAFDLILCNPPFFLTPSTGLLYCENPMELDLFARRLMRAAPAHLNEGGFFQMLFEWVELAGTPWRERLGEWADGLGCDVWIVKTYTMTPIAYGKERYSQRPGTQEANDAAFADWIAYYQQRRIEAVHGGFVALRRRTGKNWIRMEDDATVTLAHPVGELILEGFAAQDLIESPDEILSAAKLRLHDRARLRQFLRREGAKWTQSGLALTAPGAFGRELEVQPLVAEFVRQFDGARTLRELILDLAERVDADRERVASECIDITRKLLERGFLARAIE